MSATRGATRRPGRARRKIIINANSGLQPKDVLYDLVGSGSALTVTGGGQIDGTILAPDRDVKLSVVKVNGEVIFRAEHHHRVGRLGEVSAVALRAKSMMRI